MASDALLLPINSYSFTICFVCKEWILEIMAEYLQSPVWKNPLISFVEQKCVVFEDQDENSLEYTEIHRQFKSLIERQLEAYI